MCWWKTYYCPSCNISRPEIRSKSCLSFLELSRRALSLPDSGSRDGRDPRLLFHLGVQCTRRTGSTTLYVKCPDCVTEEIACLLVPLGPRDPGVAPVKGSQGAEVPVARGLRPHDPRG